MEITVESDNQAPEVSLVADFSVQEGQSVSITATASDTDGQIANYQWSQLSGASVSIENDTTLTMNFSAPLVEQDTSLEFQITVLDDDGDPIPAGQDGHLGFDANSDDSDGHAGFNFTKLDENGNDLLASATEWSCVKDNITGCIWEVKSSLGGLQDSNNSYTWFNTDVESNGGTNGTENGGSCTQSNCDTAGYIVAINALGLCADSDWEMPTIAQLRSIVDYSVLNPEPTIDANYFPNNETRYWTSTPKGTAAWVILFIDGSDLVSSRNTRNSVRLVRKGQ